jgi:Domain of unknown function (DUF929)
VNKSRSYIIIAVMAVAIVIVAALVLTGNRGGAANLTSFDNVPVSQSLMASLMVPNAVSATIGLGLAADNLKNASGPVFEVNGKPAVLYVGADYCPYCAITRWGLVVALLRFGNFTGLRYMTSSPVDLAPSASTFTFYNSTYSSSYISFVSVETAGNTPVNGSYPKLQSLNGTEIAIMQRFDSGGGIPFMDFANQSYQSGASFSDPTILVGRNWTAIAGSLTNTSTVDSMAIVGSANLFTAEICRVDGNQPAGVCGQGYVTAIEKGLK